MSFVSDLSPRMNKLRDLEYLTESNGSCKATNIATVAVHIDDLASCFVFNVSQMFANEMTAINLAGATSARGKRSFGF